MGKYIEETGIHGYLSQAKFVVVKTMKSVLEGTNHSRSLKRHTYSCLCNWELEMKSVYGEYRYNQICRIFYRILKKLKKLCQK